MNCKEILSQNAQISTEVIAEKTLVEGMEILHYGLKVSMSVDGKLVSYCVIPAISDDVTFVDDIAADIVSRKISPAAASDFVESELSK